MSSGADRRGNRGRRGGRGGRGRGTGIVYTEGIDQHPPIAAAVVEPPVAATEQMLEQRGARAVIDGLVSRPDLNGREAELLELVETTGRWRVRVEGGEIVAVKKECIILGIEKTLEPRCSSSDPPQSSVLWQSDEPPKSPVQRVIVLHRKIGKIAMEANHSFVAGGGVAAVVDIAFGAWPTGSLANSTHWADTVVEFCPHVFHSARRVALSGLAEMISEGEPYVSAIASDSLLRATYPLAAASLLPRYRWRQPYASIYCPVDHDQGQHMAERLVNIASQALFKWKTLHEGEAHVVEAATINAVRALVLPILHSIPADLPAVFALDSPAERRRADKALKAARAEEDDKFVWRAIFDEPDLALRLSAEQLKVLQRISQTQTVIDEMADGIGRMLGAVMDLSCRYPKPIDAPWMPSVVAAGAAPKLKSLMAAALEAPKSTYFKSSYAWRALDFFTTLASGGTGASTASSCPNYATKVKTAQTDRTKGLSGFNGKTKAKGECARCGCISKLSWCAGCGLVGYCSKECQKRAWGGHKSYCKIFTDMDCFVAHTMAIQTEPFSAGPWRGRMPAEVRATLGDGLPVYSKRQLSLTEYVAMLSSTEKAVLDGHNEAVVTRDDASGVSQYGFVTWARAGVVAATHTHGAKLRLCSNSMCTSCCVVWRQTEEARLCQVCEPDRPLASISLARLPSRIYMRTVSPDPSNGEPRLHMAELETCSERCKAELLIGLSKNASLSSNDIIDSAEVVGAF